MSWPRLPFLAEVLSYRVASLSVLVNPHIAGWFPVHQLFLVEPNGNLALGCFHSIRATDNDNKQKCTS